jgi:hypothetical protein
VRILAELAIDIHMGRSGTIMTKANFADSIISFVIKQRYAQSISTPSHLRLQPASSGLRNTGSAQRDARTSESGKRQRPWIKPAGNT